MNWTTDKIVEMLGSGAGSHGSSGPVTGFSIDSRTLQSGQCFVALAGPNFDGHDFVRQALDRGATACIVSEQHCPGYPPELRNRLISVPDTLTALHALARARRRAWGCPVIGITGSVGKTTTKEMLAAILATRLRVHKSEGNLNNEYGLPLSLLALRDEDEVAVLEMGMAHKGEITRLCRIAEPDMGVVVSVAPVHLEFFESIEDIAAAKRELVEGLDEKGTAVLNADDDRVAAFAAAHTGRTVRFGTAPGTDCRAVAIEDSGLAGSAFDLYVGTGQVRVRLPMPGRQHVTNALAACAAASLFDIPLEAMREALERFRPAPMRGEVIRFEQGITVVNDVYNSNPVALKAMIEALSRTPEAERRLLVAGEMKELGDTSATLHAEAGSFAAGLGNLDYLAGVEGDARHIVEGARAAGMDDDRAVFFEGKPDAGEWLCATARAGDWILLKGSRGVGLEDLLDTLRARFGAGVPAGRGAE